MSFHSARYYVPFLHRWCNADPAGLIDGVNIYSYTHDNPINYMDKSGTDAIDEAVARLEAHLSSMRNLFGQIESLRTDFSRMISGRVETYNRTLRQLEQLRPSDTRRRAFLERRLERVGAEIVERTSEFGSRATRLLSSVLEIEAQQSSTRGSATALFSELENLVGHSHRAMEIPSERMTSLRSYIGSLRSTVEATDASTRALSQPLGQFIANQSGISRMITSTVGVAAEIPTEFLENVPSVRGSIGSLPPRPPPMNTLTEAASEVSSGARRGILRRIAESPLTRRGLAVIPIIGIGANLMSAYEHYGEGSYVAAGADLFGCVPGAGDLLDAFRLGYGEGQTVTVQEEREIERQWVERMHPRVREEFCATHSNIAGCQ